jgi:hypothetical protein
VVEAEVEDAASDESGETAGDLLVIVRAALRAVYEGTAVPLSDGKTASGQVEKNQFYHRISVLLKGLAVIKGPMIFHRESISSRTTWRWRVTAMPICT